MTPKQLNKKDSYAVGKYKPASLGEPSQDVQMLYRFIAEHPGWKYIEICHYFGWKLNRLENALVSAEAHRLLLSESHDRRLYAFQRGQE